MYEKTYLLLQKPELKVSTKLLYGPWQLPLKTLGQFSGMVTYKSTSTLPGAYEPPFRWLISS